jgi:hypothetical protein
MSEPSARRPRRRRGLGLASVLSMLATLIVVVVAPSPARADGLIPPGNFDCAAYPNIAWQRIFSGFDIWRAYNHQLISSSPTFDVADARVVENGLPYDVEATFSSQQSRTFSLQVSVGVTAKVGEYLSTTLGVQVVQSRTTAIGVSVTSTVPANSRVLGEYGLHAYDVEYDMQVLMKDNRHCGAGTPQRGWAHAPTVAEGWRFSIT